MPIKVVIYSSIYLGKKPLFVVEINSTTKSGFLHYNLIHCFFHLTPLEVNFSHPLGSTVTPMMSSSNMMSMLSLDLSTYWSTSSFSSADRTGQIRLSTPSPISHSGPKPQSKNVQVRLISFKVCFQTNLERTSSNYHFQFLIRILPFTHC